jgi:hypothetical protein
MIVRSVQAPIDAEVNNSFLRATRQLNGTLTDAGGTLIPNEAESGPNADGSYFVDEASFEKDGLEYTVTDADGNEIWPFLGDPFPGIPGTGAHTEKFAVEVIAYLELTAGVHDFAMSVSADRTDVNDDDGYQVFVGANPRDLFATKIAEYQRIAQAFVSNQHIENQWSVEAPVAGIYPFRIVYWQTGRAANLQWYTIVGAGDRLPVNDRFNDSRAIKAYRNTTVPAGNAPAIAEVSPLAGSSGIDPADPISILLLNGQTSVNASSIRLFLNNELVTPTISQTGARTTIDFSPDPERTTPNNLVRLEFSDSTGFAQTNEWQFAISASGGAVNPVTGQWDFDGSNLAATVGLPLEYLDGPAGLTAQGTSFGTTTALGISDIGGEPATVMSVPGDLDRNIGYIMTHGILPNGGGTLVNQYTLIMDVFVVDQPSPGAASLLQISSLNNTDDGDLFWQGGNFGQGTDGYIGKGTFTAGAWHRVAAAYDMAATPPVVVKYVNGIKQDDWTTGQSLDNPRRALQPTAILFADGDQDERRAMYVNSIQIREGRLSDAQLALLGGPEASGIPLVLPSSNVTGQWDFEFGDLTPTIGSPLRYLDGDTGLTQAGTRFGTTTALGQPDIGGEVANVMRIPGDLDRNIGYIMEHRIAPNGGGTRVNQYTLIMDVLVADQPSPGAASLLQISSVDNTDDGDLFWQGGNFGQGTDGYIGRGTFTAGSWHRVVAAYDMAANPPVVTKYVNGIKQNDWTTGQSLDNPRRALQPTAILFADGDQDERREMWASSIQIREGKLTDAQIVALGGPSASGIPIATPRSTVTGQWDFDFADLGASIGRNLAYFDGDAGVTATKTLFGITGEGEFVEVPNINGEPATVMNVPGDLDRNVGYIMEHLISPNGGGTLVNQYTLIMDVMVADQPSPGAASMLQISSLDNTDDGDLFWQGGNFGQGTDGYIGTGIFTAGTWHRVVAAYDMAANPPVVVKYSITRAGHCSPRRSCSPTGTRTNAANGGSMPCRSAKAASRTPKSNRSAALPPPEFRSS